MVTFLLVIYQLMKPNKTNNMKKVILILAVSLTTFAVKAQGVTNVKPYLKSNGTVVGGYYKTKLNSTVNDTCGANPKVNPYRYEQGATMRLSQYTTTTYVRVSSESPIYRTRKQK
jgi:hypothetical protein